MAPVPVRLAAPIPSTSPPPRPALAIIAMVALFSSGALAGASMMLTIPPPTVERCFGAPDPVACLILELDEHLVDTAR